MDDITYIILKHLNLQDSYSYALTCQDNYQIFASNHIWKHYLESIIDDETIKKLFNGNYQLTYEKHHVLNKLITILKLKYSIIDLTKLRELYVCSNQLTTLPPEIGNLTNLRELDLINNQLATLPPEIGNLSNLQELYLYDNQLTTLPPEIGNLTNLRELSLHYNQLTILPPEIGNLTNLRELHLRHNQLTTIPQVIRNIPNIRIYE